MNKSLRVVLGIIVSGACLWFVFRKFNFADLAQTLRDASYIWMIPAILAFSSNMVFRTFRWKIFLSSLGDVPAPLVFPKLLLGFFMNNILPARGGELVRALALSRSTGIATSSILGSIVAERLSDMMGLLLIIGLASRLLPWNKLPLMPILGATMGGALVVALVLHFANKSSKTGIFYRVTSGFLALRSPRKVAAVIAMSFAIWIGEMLIPYFLSRALHLTLTFFESAGLLTGLSVGVMIPAAPGYVGTYEFFGKAALVMLGKPENAALSFVLVLHFFQLVMVALAALPSFILPDPVPREA